MTAQEAALEAKFEPFGLLSGGELFLRPGIMSAFIEEADALQLAIVGLEAFEISEDRIHPRLDLIADYSMPHGTDWETLRRRANRAARQWVGSMAGEDDIWLNATLLHRGEWSR